jgi:hypothetical protein
VACNLLMLFLTQLPETILTNELCHFLIEDNSISNPEERLIRFKHVVRKTMYSFLNC